jgi:molybdate transport system ATP-binding protein
MTLQIAGTIRVGETTIEIDLDVERGETLALVGPNGAGKTTVLHAIAGLVGLATGRIDVDGVAWDVPSDGTFLPAAKRRVGAVFQHYRLFEQMSARDNVAFGLRARGRDRASARAAADHVLARLGVADTADQRPSELSGGQAQRVAIARALVVEPAVLLLDEPMAALDIAARGAIRRDLGSWIGAIDAHRLLVTHDPVDAHALADRVVVLEAGHVTQKGTLTELATAPRSNYTAELMGTNLLLGTLADGLLAVDGGGELSVGAHVVADGPVIATIRPAAVALHRSRPEGSPRNVWETAVAGVEVLDGRVRVRLTRPFELVVEVTGAGLAALDVAAGDSVWASVKASEIGVVSDG